MITAIDTNVIVALWQDGPTSEAAQSALDRALAAGSLVISPPVFAELLAAPGRDAKFIDFFLGDTGISVDWNLAVQVWRMAGLAFQRYAIRRHQQRLPGPRRILTDFVIGAHAAVNSYPFLTLDARLYRAAFPNLRLVEAM